MRPPNGFLGLLDLAATHDSTQYQTSGVHRLVDAWDQVLWNLLTGCTPPYRSCFSINFFFRCLPPYRDLVNARSHSPFGPSPTSTLLYKTTFILTYLSCNDMTLKSAWEKSMSQHHICIMNNIVIFKRLPDSSKKFRSFAYMAGNIPLSPVRKLIPEMLKMKIYTMYNVWKIKS